MCNCMNEMLTKVKDKVLEKLPEHKEGTFEARFQNTFFRFDGGGTDVMLGIDYSYRPIKKDGSLAARDKKDNISLAMRYCPFCGNDSKDGK